MSTSTADPTNSTTAADEPPDANAQALEEIEAEAKRAGLDRLPRRGEGLDPYLLTIARHRGAIAQDAHVPDVAGTVKALLDHARRDEIHRNSPIGKALLAGAAIWPRMNPEIKGVGKLGSPNRRGVRVAVAHLVQELERDPARAERLSLAEATLLTRFAGDELVEAVEALSPAIEAARARVRETAEAELARPHYDGVLPRESQPPAPEPVPLGRTSQLRPESLTPVITAADLQRSR